MANTINALNVTTTVRFEKLSLYVYDDKGSYNECDLRSYYTDFNIYNSIDSHMMSGDVTINSDDMYSDFPSRYSANGREFIEICLTTVSGAVFTYSFVVYSIDSTYKVDSNIRYTIRFVDSFGMLNNDIRISKSYTARADEIIMDVFKIVNKYDKLTNDGNGSYNSMGSSSTNSGYKIGECVCNTNDLSDTTYAMNIVVPLWRPLRLLEYVTSHTVSKVCHQCGYKFCDCVFFENRGGDFVFTSFESMFKNCFTSTPFQQVYPNMSDGSNNIPPYFINTFSLSDLYNIQVEKASGFYGFSDYSLNLSLSNTMTPTDIMTKAQIQEEISSYCKKSGIDNYVFRNPVKSSTESLYMFGIDCINTSKSESPHKYDELTKPFQRGHVFRPLLTRYHITLDMMTCYPELELGQYIKIGSLQLPNVKQNIANKAFEYINEISGVKWVVDSIRHHIVNDGSATTTLTAFSPTLNFTKISKPTEISTHTDATSTVSSTSGLTAQVTSSYVNAGGDLSALNSGNSGEPIRFHNDEKTTIGNLWANGAWQKRRNPFGLGPHMTFPSYYEAICYWYKNLTQYKASTYFVDNNGLSMTFYHFLEKYVAGSEHTDFKAGKGNYYAVCGPTDYNKSKKNRVGTYFTVDTVIHKNSVSDLIRLIRCCGQAESSHTFDESEILACWRMEGLL